MNEPGSENAIPTTPLRIFVAEDSAADRFWLEMVFRSARVDHTIAAVSDGEAARNYLQQHTGADPDVPDLVFLDQNMPRLTAMEILQGLPNIKALQYCIVTGSATEKEQWVKEFGLSPHCYILKPLTQAKLVECLRGYDSLRPIADAIAQSSLNSE